MHMGYVFPESEALAIRLSLPVPTETGGPEIPTMLLPQLPHLHDEKHDWAPPHGGIKCDPESRESIWHIIGNENCERWATAQPQVGSAVRGEPTTAPDHPTPPACRMLALLPTLCVSSFWRGQPSCPAQNKLPDTYPGYVLWFAAKRENILKHKRAEVTGSTNVESPRDAKSFLAPHFLWSPLKLQKDGALGFPPLGSGFAERRSEHRCDFLPWL